MVDTAKDTSENERREDEVRVATCAHCQAPFYSPRAWNGPGPRPVRQTCRCSSKGVVPVRQEPILFKRAGR